MSSFQKIKVLLLFSSVPALCCACVGATFCASGQKYYRKWMSRLTQINSCKENITEDTPASADSDPQSHLTRNKKQMSECVWNCMLK